MRSRFKAFRAACECLECRRLLSSNPTVIDLLVLYTTQAKTDQGGDTAIQSEIQGVVDFTNRAMQNSQIPVTIRLVRAQEITGYTATGSVMQDELNMQGSGNNPSFHAAVLALRNQYGADLVDLITAGSTPSSEGGFSQQMASLTPNDTLGYSAIDERSLGPSNDTLAHEIGHNLGSAHARNQTQSDPQPGATNDAYGYNLTDPVTGTVYDDIMSVSSNSVRVPLYSNPNLTVDGMPFGLAGSADLAAAFPITAPIVAGYRSTVVTDTSPPSANIVEMDPKGQTLTFTVRYRDDEAVDMSTIASNNVYVTTPEGFSLGAELVSVTGGSGNSYEKLTTYRVTLPTANEPLSSLQVMLRANQIKDINGNITPAGQLTWGGDDPGNDDVAAARNLGVPSPTVIVSDSLSAIDTVDLYKFTISSAQTVSVHISGLTNDADGMLYQDANHDDLLEGNEQIATTFNPGSSIRALDENLSAGTYYLRLATNLATAYTLTLNAFTDTTPPTATSDTTDVETTGVTAAQFAVNYSDNDDLDGQSVRFDSKVNFHVQLDNGATFDTFTFPDSSNTDNEPQDAPTYRTSYSYFAGTGGFTSNDNGLYTISIPANTVQDAAGNFIPQTTLGSFRIKVGAADTDPPTIVPTPINSVTVPGPTTFNFNVTYHDNIALNAGSLDGSDLKVTGPKSFSQFASLISVTSAPTIGANRVATYRIVPPGGSWDYLDDGTYTISLQPNQVKDSSNNFAAATTAGTFTVGVPLPGDATGDGKTNALDFNVLATNFGKYGRGFATGDFNIDGLVNTSDFTLLASKFNQSLAAPLPGGGVPDLFSTTRIDERAPILPSDSR